MHKLSGCEIEVASANKSITAATLPRAFQPPYCIRNVAMRIAIWLALSCETAPASAATAAYVHAVCSPVGNRCEISSEFPRRLHVDVVHTV